MIVTIVLPDEIYSIYAERNPEKPAYAMAEQLKRFKDFSPFERDVVLAPAVRLALEKLYGKAIEDQEKFVKWVEGLLTLKAGGVDVPLSEGQQKLLAQWERYGGRPAATILGEKVKEGILNAFQGVA